MKRKFGFYSQLALTLALCAFLIVPVVQSVLAGLTTNFLVGFKSGLTFKWLIQVWDLYRETIFLSFLIGLACLAVTAIIGVPAAYFLAKRPGRLTQALEELLVVPVAVPGLATALALIITYGGFTDFRKSWLFILVGHVIFTLPFMVRSVLAVMASINLDEIEESAASLGAGFWRRFVDLVLPNSLPGTLAGALMVLTLSVGEFNLTWMLHTPLTKTLPVGLADAYASMRLEVASAYTVVFFVMIVPLLMFMQRVAGWGPKPKKRVRPAPSLDAAAPAGPAHGPAVPPKERPMLSGVSIRLERCSKTFPDGTLALEPLDLTVAAGETVAVLGPSGCGKTTTLRIIAGLESPDAGGRVFFEDEDVTDRPIEKRNVGMVFQSYALFPNMSVAENVAYGLKVRGMDKAEIQARVAEMLAMMQIEPLAARRIDQLSGGQKQRVALARAIAVRPRVLLLDEPLTALDAKLRDSLRVEINALLRSLAITAIYVTHDQAEAMALGDRIIVMDQGKVAQAGTPRDIYFRPQSRFVAEFVGALNFLKAAVAGGRLDLGQGPGEIELPDWPDGPTQVFFRPEQATVVAPGQGHLPGQVRSASFQGDKTRLQVAGPGGEIMLIDAAGALSFTPGQEVGVRLATEGLFTLAGQGV